MRTDIEMLVLEDCILEKSEQPVGEADDSWRQEFELD
jgi:carbamoyltransferase